MRSRYLDKQGVRKSCKPEEREINFPTFPSFHSLRKRANFNSLFCSYQFVNSIPVRNPLFLPAARPHPNPLATVLNCMGVGEVRHIRTARDYFDRNHGYVFTY